LGPTPGGWFDGQAGRHTRSPDTQQVLLQRV